MENGTSSSDGGPEAEHPLQQPWQLYLHYPTITTITQSLESYGKEAYQALCEFSTVEGFWAYFHFLPRPSDIFTEVVAGSYPPQLLKRKLDGKNLEAFGLFKKVRLIDFGREGGRGGGSCGWSWEKDREMRLFVCRLA
jgi:hypothetical protein